MARKKRDAPFPLAEGLPVKRDPLARWRSFAHRGTNVEFITSGIVVNATCPAELASETDAEIVQRLRSEPEN